MSAVRWVLWVLLVAFATWLGHPWGLLLVATMHVVVVRGLTKALEEASRGVGDREGRTEDAAADIRED